MNRIKKYLILLIISISFIFLNTSCSNSKPRYYKIPRAKYHKETSSSRKKDYIPKYKKHKKPPLKRYILVGQKRKK
ncbi:MAG: hypothetical protein J7J86_06420 [Bacteroidales bacterium]|nr:hypothetical protein [Bacteroidales bacterium]